MLACRPACSPLTRSPLIAHRTLLTAHCSLPRHALQPSQGEIVFFRNGVEQGRARGIRGRLYPFVSCDSEGDQITLLGSYSLLLSRIPRLLADMEWDTLHHAQVGSRATLTHSTVTHSTMTHTPRHGTKHRSSCSPTLLQTGLWL